MLVRCHEEDCLHARVEAGVHARHLELVFEVGDGPQAADDDRSPSLGHEVHEQVVEGLEYRVALFGYFRIVLVIGEVVVGEGVNAAGDLTVVLGDPVVPVERSAA